MTEPSPEALATLLLEQFERDLLLLVQRDEYQVVPHVVITGLLEVAGQLMRGGVQREPAALPTLLGQIERLRARVQPAEVPDRPMH